MRWLDGITDSMDVQADDQQTWGVTGTGLGAGPGVGEEKKELDLSYLFNEAFRLFRILLGSINKCLTARTV